MGKLSGILAGFSVLALMEFFVLSNYFYPIENWITPYFGPETYLFFGLLYFILGDPLNNILLITTLVLVAVTVGLAARKGSRAIGAAISIFSLSWLFIILSGVYMLTESGILGSGGSLPIPGLGGSSLPTPSFSGLSSLLGTVPQGTNLALIMEEPIIRRIPYILPGLESSLLGGGGISSNIAGTLLPFIIYDIINFVILVTISGVVGYIVGRVLRRKKTVPSEEKSVPTVQAASLLSFIAVIVVVLVLLSSGGIAGGHSGTNPNGSLDSTQIGKIILSNPAELAGLPASAFSLFSGYSDTASGAMSTATSGSGFQTANFLISPNGSLYTLMTMTQPEPVFSIPAQSGLGGPNFAIMMDSSSLMNLLYNPLATSNSASLGSLSIKSLLNLLPPQMLLLGYGNNTSISTASSAASKLFSDFGISNQALILSLSGSSAFNIPGLNSSSYFIFGSTDSFGGSMSNYSTSLTGTFGTGGIASMLSSEVNDGWIIPGSTNDSFGSTIFMCGFVSSSEFSNFDNAFPIRVNASSASPSGMVQFAGLFASNDFRISSQQGNENMTASMLTGSNSTFSLNSTVQGMVTLISPGIYPYNFTIPGMSGYYFNIFSNSGSLVQSMGLNASYPGVHVNSSMSFAPDTVLGNISGKVTEPVFLSDTISATSASSVTVNATVWNNGSLPIYNVRISSGFSTGYSSLIVGTTGSGNHTFTEIGAHSNATFSVSYKLQRSGNYYFQPSLIEYTYNNSSYARYSPSASKQIGSESMITAYSEPFDSEVGAILGPQFETIPFINIPLLLGIFGLLVILDLVIEYRALKRWLHTRA